MLFKIRFNIKTIIRLTTILFFLLNITGCGQQDVSNKKIFEKYYYLGSNICSFNGTLIIKSSETKHVISYKISYNLGIGCKIVKFINNTKDSVFILNNDKINFTKSISRTKTEVYNDTEENRLKLGIPINIGIDPYYFLETDKNFSKITYPDKDTIIILYEKDKINLKAVITINDGKIKKITASSNGVDIYNIHYTDFRELGNNTAYPEKFIQNFVKDGKEIARIESEYIIESIKLCN